MTAFLAWYLLALIFGCAVFPLAYRLLPGLPNRGYAISKALGLLLVGYVLWIGASFGFITNSLGGVIIALAVVTTVSIWLYQRNKDKASSLGGWLKSNWPVVLGSEIVFLVAFAAWTIVRAHSPEIRFTEKPMELAFLNGIRASDTFPPQDPWLSGYAISYYYFGYVIVSMLATLSGVPSAVAFNLAIALLFGLTAVGAYGLVYNLVTSYWRTRGQDARGVAAVTAIIAPIFTVLVGNLMGLVDAIHARAWLPNSFWQWLDIAEVDQRLMAVAWPPPQARPGWWWWRASRVIRERTPVGDEVGVQPIDEFPMFSFILGDMHPHVLILPFIMVALALAFNALNQQSRLDYAQIGLYALAFGALPFLNAWDFPIYGFVLGVALIMREVHLAHGKDLTLLIQPVLIAASIVGIGFVLYLPWYLSFSSQAGGILPNLLIATPFQQFFVMYGVFLPLIVLFIIDALFEGSTKPAWSLGIILSSGLLGSLIVIAIALGLIVVTADVGVRDYFLVSTGVVVADFDANGIRQAINQGLGVTLLHRLQNPATPLFLTALLAGSVALLFARRSSTADVDENHPRERLPSATLFALILVLTATLLTLGPEFVYLRDNFGQRINTIFKFYYAAWILFAVGSAYAVHLLIANRNPLTGVFSLVLTLVLVAGGMLYPAWGITNRTSNFQVEPTLDGLAFLEQSSPAELEVIDWLQDNAEPAHVIVEAVGGAYSDHGRISSATGLQTIIGWDNHQRQWRGDTYDFTAAGREDEVRQIYSTTSLEQAEAILQKYNVTYIIVGPRERSTDVSTLGGIEKFVQSYVPVFQNEEYIIFRTHSRVLTDTGP